MIKRPTMNEKTYTDNRIAAKELVEIPSRDASPSSSDDWSSEPSSSSDVHELFAKFNKQFFWGKLDEVKLEWSNIMTSCAGKCYSRPRQKYYCIRLSRPLLRQRPHSDLVDTLLHEMIHAYLAVTKTREVDSHGGKFHEHMHRINKAAGTNISVYHTFHAEVKSLKRHWWRCDGPCQNRGPFYGWVKRATNRAPGPWDTWWRSHSYRCGGRFVKVKEPVDYTMKRVKGLFGYGTPSSTSRLALNNFGFEFIHSGETFWWQNKVEFAHPHATVSTGQSITRNYLTECPICMKRLSESVLSEHINVCGELQRLFEDDLVDLGEKDLDDRRKSEVDMSTCPVCEKVLLAGKIQEHLQNCDRLQGIFDENNFVRTEGTCPCCCTVVQGDLSLHISRCLSTDILSISDENDFESKTKGEEGFGKCIVCEETLRNISLKDHLESCKGLDGIFDDNIVEVKDDRVCRCVNPDDSVLNTCPICGLEVRNGLNYHLERDCLSTIGVSEELGVSLLPGNLKATIRNSNVFHEVVSKTAVFIKSGDSNFLACNESRKNKAVRPFSRLDVGMRDMKNHIKTSLDNSDHSRSIGVGVKSSCVIENISRNITNQSVLKDDSEPLIFCRGCGKFYSVFCCPVCCEKK